MEQKLLAVVSRRTAWVLLGGCIVFWGILAAGLLRAPADTPTALMFLWLYCALMAALASTVLAAAAVAALMLHRSAARTVPDSASGAAPAPGPGVPEPRPAAPETDKLPETEPEDSGAGNMSVTEIQKLLARRR